MENFDVEQARKTVENINKMEDKSFGFGTVLIFWGIAAFAVILIIGAVASFPIIEFKGSEIRMFAPGRILGGIPPLNEITRPQEVFDGRVLGEHILETEHGKITLGRSSLIRASDNTVGRIDVETFRQGYASHNLVIDGIKMPSHISINFDTWIRSNPQISSLAIGDQEIIISGIPLVVRLWSFPKAMNVNSPGLTGDISANFWGPQYITLSDYTQIKGRYLRHLNIYKDEERWRISSGRTFVKRPWETEFTEYRSITFRPNWGEFIEGVRLE